ncbi:MAG: Sporulation kinase E [Smithella sp. PtaU1.Bin162]|nr:MAG: Sporulation kinase E [Smithella sp. PtaU1.Bin162]
MVENREVTIEEKDKTRLNLLIIFRLIIITLFLGVAIFIDIKKTGFPVSVSTLNFFYFMIAATYFFSIAYILLLRIIKDLKINIYLQSAVDVLLVTLLVYITGSLNSNYSVLYTLVIIYSVIFLGRYGGLIIASAAGIFYGLLLDFEFYKIIPSVPATEHNYDLTAEDVFIRILVHIVSFYVLAFLASFVVEQEKKTRHLLQERESAFNQLDLLFRSIIESVDTGVMTIDLKGTIKTFNRAAEEITGFPFSSVKNKPVTDVLPELAVFPPSERKLGQTKNRMEIILQGKNGKKLNLGCSTSPLRDKQDKQIGSILIFQDLTEIKLMEETLEKSKRLALIGEMAAGLAHEMRNPLASITGSIELLRQSLNLKDTDERLMQIIVRGKEQLDNFVRDFLLLARPIPQVRELINVSEIAQDVLENIKLSKDWTSKIKINSSLTEKVTTHANAEQIRQIVHNLVLNAIQAMEEGGILSVNVKSIIHHNKEVVELIISDTGPGIDENELQKIFEPFYTNKDKGTGLGLAIVSRIVDGYGGRIKMESDISKGTVCTVWLPSKR